MTDDPGQRYDEMDFDQDDDLDEDGNPKFECARFWIKGEGWYCPMAGTEECDWECPE